MLVRRVRRLKLHRRHPFVVPFFTFGILLVLTAIVILGVAISNRHAKPAATNIVIISHDQEEQIVPSSEPTVRALLKKLDLTLNEGDVVEPGLDTRINQDKFRINIYRAVPVEVEDATGKTFAFSAARTPRSIAAQSGQTVYAEDYVTTEPAQNFLKDGAIGERVVIDRATPVAVNLYGSNVTIRTHAKTVGQLVKEKKIHLQKSDTVTPGLDTPLASVQKLYIDRNGQRVENVTEPIAMPIQVINDSGLAYGTSAVRQAGAPGERVTTYQIILKNGQEVGRTVIQAVVTKPPVTQIVVQGTSLSGIKGDMALAGIAPGDYNYVDYIVSHESGWCPTKAQGQYGSCPPYAGYVPSYGGYGLCQSTPGSKMASAGADWATNPVTQLRWCSSYAQGRYGSWYAAYKHWLAYHNW